MKDISCLNIDICIQNVDASYQVSVHLAKRFQRRILKINQSETRGACGGHVC
jgi:hypothetical protein